MSLTEKPADEMVFNHIDTFEPKAKPNQKGKSTTTTNTDQVAWAPEKLDNGKWACNHKCKDKKM